jgi:dGTPase
MVDDHAAALAAFRAFNYEQVYLRPASRVQAAAVIDLLHALVEHYADRPNLLPAQTEHYGPVVASGGLAAGSPEALHEAVRYVSGMTDRFACRQGMMLLGWGPERLPQGVGVHP